MNLDELQSVRDRERQTDKLQQLRESFYADAGSFIQQLRDERDRAADRADNPYDAPEVQQLTDEINTAEQTVENIYEKRVGKLVKAASFAAADLPAEVDGMTAEEQDLFDALVDDIKGNREHVLDVLAGEATPTDSQSVATEPPAGESTTDTPTPETPSPDQSPAESAPVESDVSAADVMGGDERDAPPVPPLGGEDADAVDQSPPDQTGEDSPPIRNDGGTPAQTAASSEAPRDSPDEEGSNDGATQMSGVERETVRITDDVGTFVGFDDREYDLSTNDVVQLPATNVGPLLEQGVAEQLR